MKTPIVDFVRRYAESGATRFHMPGHKGAVMLGCEPLDITEIDGADVLYEASGIIGESERNAAGLFQTAHSYYSAEGSSLCIKAMLALVAERGGDGKRPLILAARNVHRTFLYAAALLDLDVAWLLPEREGHLCSCSVSKEQVARAVESADRTPAAVYLTSPDYLGQMADVEGIAGVCHANGIPLLVDNAHGAYLKFLKNDRHPITLGADLCCDSAHKTLPVLTGGAYLHVSGNADPEYCRSARRMLSMFASTSPSYLILQSLDLCNRYLATDFCRELAECVARMEELREALRRRGICAEESEPLKLVICAGRLGYRGDELAAYLRRYNVEAEFSDGEYLVLMATPQNTERDFLRLRIALERLPLRVPMEATVDGGGREAHEVACTVREGMLSSRRETVRAEESVGRVCAAPTVSCPPAVPVVMCGERITEADAERLLRYGIEEVEVLIEPLDPSRG